MYSNLFRQIYIFFICWQEVPEYNAVCFTLHKLCFKHVIDFLKCIIKVNSIRKGNHRVREFKIQNDIF
jgi:hypothetical protein